MDFVHFVCQGTRLNYTELLECVSRYGGEDQGTGECYWGIGGDCGKVEGEV